MARIQASPSGHAIPRDTTPGEIIVELAHVTLSDFTLQSNGMGYRVSFLVPLENKYRLAELTDALQRNCKLTLTRSAWEFEDGDDEDDDAT